MQNLNKWLHSECVSERVCVLYTVSIYLYIFPYLWRTESRETETFDLQPAQKQLKLKEQCQIYYSTEKHWYYVCHYSVTSLDFCQLGARFIIVSVLNAKGYVLLIFLFFSGAMTSCLARIMGKRRHKPQVPTLCNFFREPWVANFSAILCVLSRCSLKV